MKKFFLLLFCSLGFLGPLPALAQSPLLHFGGYVLLSIPCCVPGTFQVFYLAPTPYPSTYPWRTRSLLMTPATIKYAHQEFLLSPTGPPPTSWHLGTFLPTPTPCMVGEVGACVPSPVLPDGVMVYLGSSSPGWPSPVGI